MTRRTLTLAMALFLTVPSVSLVGAQDENKEEEVPISLEEALQTALENNLDLVIAKRDPQIADLGVDVEKGVFNPVVGAGGSYSETNTDSDFEDRITGLTGSASSDSSILQVNPYWQQSLTFGGLYKIGLLYTDQDTNNNGINQFTHIFERNQFTSENTELNLHFEMPLLFGFGKEVRSLNLLLAESNRGISRQTLQLQAESTMKLVEDAYWNVAGSRRAVDVANQTLKLAQDLFDLNKKKVDVGTLAPIEITQAEAGVASRQEGVITARVLRENLEDELLRLMAVPPDDPRWSKRLVPTTAPKFEQVPAEVDTALATALQERPEVQTARRQLEDSELRERVAKKGVRHRLDLAVDVNPSILDLSSQNTPLTTFPPTSDVTNSDSTNWIVGLNYAYPIGNRTAKANAAIATLSREKSELALANAEQNVRVDVRTAVRNVQSGAERITAAHSNTVLQTKTVEAEQKKLENGMSTSFEVLRIQTDLSDAQLAEIQAVLDYNKALADLERAKGTLLEARGLTLEEPEPEQ